MRKFIIVLCFLALICFIPSGVSAGDWNVWVNIGSGGYWGSSYGYYYGGGYGYAPYCGAGYMWTPDYSGWGYANPYCYPYYPATYYSCPQRRPYYPSNCGYYQPGYWYQSPYGYYSWHGPTWYHSPCSGRYTQPIGSGCSGYAPYHRGQTRPPVPRLPGSGGARLVGAPRQ